MRFRVCLERCHPFLVVFDGGWCAAACPGDFSVTRCLGFGRVDRGGEDAEVAFETAPAGAVFGLEVVFVERPRLERAVVDRVDKRLRPRAQQCVPLLLGTLSLATCELRQQRLEVRRNRRPRPDRGRHDRFSGGLRRELAETVTAVERDRTRSESYIRARQSGSPVRRLAGDRCVLGLGSKARRAHPGRRYSARGVRPQHVDNLRALL